MKIFRYFLTFLALTLLLAKFAAAEEPSVFDDYAEDDGSVSFPLPKSLQKNLNKDIRKKPVAKTEEEIERSLGKRITPPPSSSLTPKARAQSLFLSFYNVPKRVYVGEIFPVSLKSIAVFSDLKSLNFSLVGGRDYKLLNPEALFEKIDENEYKITLYFKLTSPSAKIPSIKVTAVDNGGYRESSVISVKNLKVVPIRKSKDFCGVLADSLKVLRYKTTRFDENSYMFVMKIEAKRANVEDFHLEWVLRDKIESKEGDFLDSKFIYLAFIPETTQRFNFKYFNLKEGRFESFSYPVKLEKEELSTQIELNPKASKFDIYKNIFLSVIAFIFLLLFFFKIKKSKFAAIVYLMISLAIFAYVIKDELPFSDVTLKKGAKVKILPTTNSTIFYTADKKIRVKVLNRVGHYYKVVLPNEEIGWVRDEDLE